MKRFLMTVGVISLFLLLLSCKSRPVTTFEIEIDYNAAQIAQPNLSKTALLDEFVLVLEKRLDLMGAKGERVWIGKENTIFFSVKGVIDQKLFVKNFVKKILEKGSLDFKLVEKPEYVAGTKEKLLEQIGTTIPDGFAVYEGVPDNNYGQFYYLLRVAPSLSGKYIVDAKLGYDQNGMYAVDFKFNSEGAKLFGDLTANNIGKQIAIVFDEKVLSAPAIRSKITKRGQITGNFTIAEADDLAMYFKSGGLPCSVKSVNIIPAAK